MSALTTSIAEALDRPVSPIIATAANQLAGLLDGQAVLFYGSVLRSCDLDGVLDFYVLTNGPRHRGVRRLANRWLWPDVSYHELTIGRTTIRAKVATMTIEIFTGAAGDRFLDTTIWARFVQPAALVWCADEHTRRQVNDAIASAAITAARYAAALGPRSATARAFWQALFAATYRTELRVEQPGRETQIIDNAPTHFDRLLPLAWSDGKISLEQHGAELTPHLSSAERRRLLARWASRQRAGKLLNLARLAKASFTFDGAARYALWKVERHTGKQFVLTPWRERHPILAAPGVLWQVWRNK